LLNYYNNRLKNYKDLSKANVYKSIAMAITQLSIGFVKHGAMGLISGQIISQLVSNTKLLKNIIKDKMLLLKISKVKIIAFAKKYKNFPIYSLGGTIATVISQNLLNIFISIFFGISVLGQYSLVQRILGVPMIIIGNSIGSVFFQKASKEQIVKGNVISIVRTVFKKLFIGGLILFVIIYFFIKYGFVFLFGEKWIMAAEYSKILIPLFFIRFIFLPLSNIYDIFNALKIEFFMKIFYLVIVFYLLFLFKDESFDKFLKIYVIVSFFVYVLNIIIIFNLVKGNKSDRKRKI
jgi:O-antigen/teichoic acid export membrane protein